MLDDADVLVMKAKVFELTYHLLKRHPLVPDSDASDEAKRAADEWFKRVKLAICEAEE